ncbi:hypothetical protein COO60DRAFT_721976 [Scenedesmus sp. NREL 46B-D3]|nr:hypothetical protein COO60DRAFT_721976 [Scenedesmus sp. NREL 46B-D3]
MFLTSTPPPTVTVPRDRIACKALLYSKPPIATQGCSLCTTRCCPRKGCKPSYQLISSMLSLKPIHRAALTSCSLMTFGDAACQAIQCQRNKRPVSIDGARAARFGLIGLTLHGPFSSIAGSSTIMQRCVCRCSARTPMLCSLCCCGCQAVTKSLVGQVTLFPSYTSLVLLYSSLLEGRSMQEACEQVKQKLPKLFATGSVYWPTVNVANFMFVPPQQRVLAVNACAILWNTYLSYVNAAPLSLVREAAAS